MSAMASDIACANMELVSHVPRLVRMRPDRLGIYSRHFAIRRPVAARKSRRPAGGWVGGLNGLISACASGGPSFSASITNVARANVLTIVDECSAGQHRNLLIRKATARALRAHPGYSYRDGACSRRHTQLAITLIRSTILIVAKFENVSEIAYGKMIWSRWRIAPQV